ncbi:translation initiation factor IF-2-like [Prionailurus bengalensis]|uniref:translation initiation factor IF-2-like n=1 Tax=Prionailurus bengalensis TaxID=37029 RepID=UPI001CA8C822|nr:translation initiation factor IF-2-like [Prionailurus bengalensis]
MATAQRARGWGEWLSGHSWPCARGAPVPRGQPTASTADSAPTRPRGGRTSPNRAPLAPDSRFLAHRTPAPTPHSAAPCGPSLFVSRPQLFLGHPAVPCRPLRTHVAEGRGRVAAVSSRPQAPPRSPPPALRRPRQAGPFVSRGLVPGPAAGPPSGRAHCLPDLSAARGAAGGRARLPPAGGAPPAGLAGHFHEKGAAEAPLLAFTACLNCIDIKSRSAVNTQRGPQAAAGGQAGVGAAAPARVGSSPQGRERSGGFSAGRAGGAGALRHADGASSDSSPDPPPTLRSPLLSPFRSREGVPSKPLGASPKPGAPWNLGEEPRWGASGCARPAAASCGPPRGAEPAPTGQRQALCSGSPPAASLPGPARPRSAPRVRFKERISMLGDEHQCLFQPSGRVLPARRGRGEGAPAVGGETGDPERPLARLAPAGPQRSYPSRAAAASAACCSSAAAASARSAARSRLLLGARRPRTPLPRAQEGVWTAAKRAGQVHERRGPAGSRASAGSALGAPRPARRDCPRARRRSCLRAYPRSARAPGDYTGARGDVTRTPAPPPPPRGVLENCGARAPRTRAHTHCAPGASRAHSPRPAPRAPPLTRTPPSSALDRARHPAATRLPTETPPPTPPALQRSSHSPPAAAPLGAHRHPREPGLPGPHPGPHPGRTEDTPLPSGFRCRAKDPGFPK